MVSVVMLGASGAVGQEALRRLGDMPEVTRVTLLNRRAMTGLPESGLPDKAVEHIVDVGDPASYEHLLTGHDAAICTLGVGEPSKASREEFTRVDYDMPLAFGQACAAAGVTHFSLLSAVGVNAKSRIFYVRSKGQLEDALQGMGFARVSFAHPCIIMTPENRYGLSQAIVLAVWPWVDLALIGPLRRFRGIKVRDLGSAMALNVALPGTGAEVLEWDEMMAMVH